MNWLALLLILISASAQAEFAIASGARPGYLSSVSRERELRDVEIVIVSPPPKENSARPFVSQKLTKEFQAQYETRFGRSEVERNYNASNRFTFYEYPGGLVESQQAHAARQRKFGEFMFRRLTEHHVDQYAKSNPDFRPVYELKDKIANVNVQVRKGYKLRFKYSYSGNFLDVRLENPYEVDTKVSFQMGNGFGASAVERTIFSLAYGYSKLVTLSAFYEIDQEDSTTFLASRKLSQTLSATLTAAHDVPVDRDEWRTSPRQDLILVGLAWTE